MKIALRVLITIAFTSFVTYTGLYLMFTGGIVQFIDAIKLDPISSKGIAFGVTKIMISAPLGFLIFYLGILINVLLGSKKFPKIRK